MLERSLKIFFIGLEFPIHFLKMLKDQKAIKNRADSIHGYSLQNIQMKDFVFKRYLGCSSCTTSLQVGTGQYTCTGRECKGTENETNPKKMSCYLLKVQGIGDNVVDHEAVEFLGFNTAMLKFMGKLADNFNTDTDALNEFNRKLQGNVLTIKISYTPKSAEGSKPTFLIEDIEAFSVPEQSLSNYTTNSPQTINTNTHGSNLELNEDEMKIADELGTPSDSSDGENDDDDLELNEDEVLSAVHLSKRESIEVNVVKSNKNSFVRIKDEEIYDTSNKPGLAVVINIEEIISDLRGMTNKRKGSPYDTQLASDLFHQLGFEVVKIINVKSTDLLAELDDVKKRIRSGDFSCLFVCLSTHGRAVEVTMADGYWVNLWNDIIYRFDDQELPEFIGRPKVFLMQRCQSFKDIPFDHKANLPRADRFKQEMETDEDFNFDDLPSHPNMLVFTSNSPGYVSKRSSMGSNFFRTIALVFMNHAWNMELRQLLQMVAKIMNRPRNRKTKKQLTELKDYLFVKKFYFNP